MKETGEPVVLLVDDDPAITEGLHPYLTRAGFHVIVNDNGAEVEKSVQIHRPDLIILDILLPQVNGRDLLRRLRKNNNWTPTILLTQVGDPSERAMALEEGADDYLNKPFHPQELVARIHAVLRRAQKGQPTFTSAWKLSCDGLILDRRARRVYINDQITDLSPKAFAVLEYLMTHPDEVISRERLLKSVWGWEHPIGTRTVDTRIFELRKALKDDAADPNYIDTLTGEGYCFIAAVRVLE